MTADFGVCLAEGLAETGPFDCADGSLFMVCDGVLLTLGFTVCCDEGLSTDDFEEAGACLTIVFLIIGYKRKARLDFEYTYLI